MTRDADAPRDGPRGRADLPRGGDAGPTRRVFVGLALDAETARTLCAAADVVFEPEAWKRHGARDLHLTLCFLGDVPVARLDPLACALRERLVGRAAPNLVVSGLGAFPDTHRPRVAWVGVAGEPRELERLAELRARCVEAVHASGIAHVDDERFVPHVTLARPRGRRAWPANAARFEFSRAWRPDRVRVFESVGDGAPERYRSLCAVELT